MKKIKFKMGDKLKIIPFENGKVDEIEIIGVVPPELSFLIDQSTAISVRMLVT